ncbi:transcription-repair coupling factor [Candidatus Finniella inopinata]|nr:transcription-repair coupling factor [Candidatus Finniella inopinata]
MAGSVYLGGVPTSYQPFVIEKLWQDHAQPLLVVTSTEEHVGALQEQLNRIAPHIQCLNFPAWDCLPYDRVSPSQDIVTQRLETLTTLIHQPQRFCVITSVAALAQHLPPRLSLIGESLDLQIGQKIAREALLSYLTHKGFRRCETVYEPGDYAVRGSIVDIFPTTCENPLRLDFFDDVLDALKSFDPITQKTIAVCERVELKPIHEVTLTLETIQQFRQKYRQLFGASKVGIESDALYESISAGRSYAGMEHWLPLFYDGCETLLDYFPNALMIKEDAADQALISHQQSIHEYYQARANPIGREGTYRPLPPEQLYWTKTEWEDFQRTVEVVSLSPFVAENSQDQGGRLPPDFTAIRQSQPEKVFDQVCQTIQTHQQQGRLVVITSHTDGSRQRLESLLRAQGLKRILAVQNWPADGADRGVVYSLTAPFEQGFMTPDQLVLTEQDILGDRMVRKSPKRKKSSVFQDASQLAVGDLIVHNDHGIGRYLRLETLTVNQKAHDCLCLEYEGGDKLFLPVENLELISRYGDENSLASLDRLGSAAWQNRKSKVKKRIRVIADYLIRLAAERALHQGVVLDKISNEYDQFCARFPYAETEDQQRVIEETLNDLTLGKPMDRLVCGDVGFGKTEVALRAAYMAVANGKQVALIVPTTLLARQHYQTFRQRFHGLPYRVQQLSRLVKTKEAGEIKKDLEAGHVNIIIATQAILANDVRFHDLGLLIVDEEQHFGVKQKEKLKTLKTDVHVLTLTATPIPRTLQLALSGVRELSLITTPPIDRLAVRTFVMPYDSVVIKEAILREYHRGGQIFYVSPRLEDLATLQEQLGVLVPEVKIAIAHGQMPAAQLEDVMTAFYDRAFHVLLSTNIVESGIDIPTANTLIIHRADLFGLSQLYQLRGRVGRAKVQGYAYLTLPADKPISDTAQKRLTVMQSLDSLGAGFRLASHDMDIRGAGNIVGEEQSGHIREVGVELYQNLLQEAIIMARAEQANQADAFEETWTPQINLSMAILIPETYVKDLGLRLELYRRLAHLQERAQINEFAAELVDRFGALPREVKNLLAVIELKSLCRQAHIEKIDAGPKGLVIGFRDGTFSNPKALLVYLQSPVVHQAGATKIRPDQKLVFIREWPSEQLRLRGTTEIVKAIAALV